jgi:membrane protein implicated in regulation of membrane protease activity
MEPYAYWVVAGIALCIIEILAPSFIFLFFGLSAIYVGAIKWLGFLDHLPAELFLFSVATALQMIIYQRFLKSLWGREKKAREQLDPTGIVGQRAKVDEKIEGGIGSVIFRGARWQAQSPIKTIPSGSFVRITTLDGLYLTVVPDEFPL